MDLAFVIHAWHGKLGLKKKFNLRKRICVVGFPHIFICSLAFSFFLSVVFVCWVVVLISIGIQKFVLGRIACVVSPFSIYSWP